MGDPVKPPVHYYGAKVRLAPWIVEHMPAHEAYIEPFFGSGAVLFSKPPSRFEVANDLDDDLAVWVTSWPRPEYVRHAWPGAWVKSLFRNEGTYLSSELIIEAVAATRARWPMVPSDGMVTFVDPRKVRHKRDPGRCYRRAGFRLVGETVGGLLAFQMLPDEMPPAAQPLRRQGRLDLGVSA